jgi:hypothetical protein
LAQSKLPFWNLRVEKDPAELTTRHSC